jgi:hypothetical protein
MPLIIRVLGVLVFIVGVVACLAYFIHVCQEKQQAVSRYFTDRRAQKLESWRRAGLSERDIETKLEQEHLTYVKYMYQASGPLIMIAWGLFILLIPVCIPLALFWAWRLFQQWKLLQAEGMTAGFV